MTWTDISSPRLVLQRTSNRSYESTAETSNTVAINNGNKDNKKRKAESPTQATVATPTTMATTSDSNSNNIDKRQRQSYVDTTTSRPMIHQTNNNGNSRRRQKVQENSNAPRWHSQSYLLFLALRQHPTKSLPRTDLIKAALVLDEKISKERNVPRVFRGKTPTNSASAILTNNIDGYFVPFRPHGSRCMHFKLAFNPGNLKDAIQEYTLWETRLAREEWPLYFGKQKRTEETLPSSLITTDTMTTKTTNTTVSDPSITFSTTNDNEMTEFDAFLLSKRQVKQQQQQSQSPPLEEKFDLTNVPKTWHDLLHVVAVDGGGQQKLVATRLIPKGTPLGFYFGVPMTTDEFDSLKEGVGNAEAFSVKYKGKTVLDPTNDQGQLYDKDIIYCPFHYMRKSSSVSQNANTYLLDGPVLNQIICWTQRDIDEGEELILLRA
ncbi:hypothetical protein INT45_012063 [Circinella minor]|uniref:SET domain-containing protein n=1 Tax=Circinella minor TaxID=1195481 RepID=A0A8H7VUY2_9FUNG|nr:hypothetical protein INT45_012063 [Circinella minor]